MTPKTLLARDPALLSEREWSSLIVELARIGGWRGFHTFDSRKSNKGFPDWVFVRDCRLLFVELKSESGKLRPDQEEWLDHLRDVAKAVELLRGLAVDFAEKVDVAVDGIAESPLIEIHVWRPSDWPTVVEVLTGRRPREEAA